MSITTAVDPAQLDARWGELEAERTRLEQAIADAERRLPAAEAARDAAQQRYDEARDAAGPWGANEPPAGFLKARDRLEEAMGMANGTAHSISQNRMALGNADDALAVVRAAAVAEVARAERLLGALDRLRARLGMVAVAPVGQQPPRPRS